MKVKSESEVAQLWLTLSDPMDCSLPGSSVHGIFQARVLEWGAIASPMTYCYTSPILVTSLMRDPELEHRDPDSVYLGKAREFSELLWRSNSRTVEAWLGEF